MTTAHPKYASATHDEEPISVALDRIELGLLAVVDEVHALRLRLPDDGLEIAVPASRLRHADECPHLFVGMEVKALSHEDPNGRSHA